ncbi:MAG: cob(I)yrinic acid a,c-diamide adenosyltransferase [Anaerolineaceae bacterium]|nr:cob(I)yrinic acid a,c-diamide adenosyltransferase [Anaerolineaceae bacterium]
MKIYTKTGDNGTTSLFSGGRVSKAHHRVEAYGTVDELNAVIGVARAQRPTARTESWLERVQRQLFHLGADLATPLDAQAEWVVRVDAESVAWLETTIDTMTEALPPLANFILPGGSPAAAQLHVARTVCRRAERLVVILGEHEPINPQSLIYLNRLSDFLFTLSRWENVQTGEPEDKWALRD